MAASVHIVGIGARTPVGLDAPAAAAAVRAGLTRLGEHPFMIDQVGDPMPAAMDGQLDAGLMGPHRFLGLAETALQEACQPLEPMRNSRLRLPLYVALPEFRPGFSDDDARTIRHGLAAPDGLPLEIMDVVVFPEGHAAGLAAMARAVHQIETGAIDACLIGGVETYFQADTMEWLDANRQLAGSVSRSGFVPGEGACFCVLMADGFRTRLGLSSLARIVSAETGRETKLIKTSDICLGEGLTATVRQAVKELASRGESINSVICDINTERYRGEEWGFVCLRLPLCFDDPTGYLSPADCWGDMGAASGPLFAMLACEAARRGFSRGRHAMLWASSEGGLRGATVLENATNGTRSWRVD